MTKHYTQAVPIELAHKFYDAGLPEIHLPSPTKNMGHGIVAIQAVSITKIPTYADVLDWLIEEGMCVSVYALNVSGEIKWISHLMDISDDCKFDGSFGYKDSFDDAAKPAIEKALELLKK